MDNQRFQRRHLLAPVVLASLFGITSAAHADRGGFREPPPPPQGGGGITLQLGQSSSNRFLPRLGSQLVPVGTPVLLTWSYAQEVEDPGIPVPADPNAPTFIFPFPEQSVLVDVLDSWYTRGTWLRIVARSFDRWEAVCGITFQFVGGEASPIPDPDSDGSDYEPWDDGDRWVSVPDNESTGFYAPTDNYNQDPLDPQDVGPNTGVGDIRIAMRTIDGRAEPDGTFGSAFYYVYPFDPTAGSGNGEGNAEMGNIILDAQEIWNDPFAPNLLEVVMMRAIGEAIGIPYKCPRWTTPQSSEQPPVRALLKPQLMELQEGDFANDSGFLTRPFPQLRIVSPQEDDIRSALQLFGDPTDGNDRFSASTVITFVPEFQTDGVTYRFPNPDFFVNTSTPFELINTLQNRALVTTQFGDYPAAGLKDIDYYEIIVPELAAEGRLFIQIAPTGTDYYSIGFTVDGNGSALCDKTASQLDENDTISALGNSSQGALDLEDLRFALVTLNEVDSELGDIIANPDNPPVYFLPLEGGAEPLDIIAYRDQNTYGEAESITVPVQPGRYFLIVRGGSDCCDFKFATGGCDNAACEATVCGIDPFCCDTTWDINCVQLAVDNCDPDLCRFRGPQSVQRYRLTLELESIPDTDFAAFQTIINGDFENNIPGTGRLALTEATENGGPFTGETARIAIIAGGLAFTGHSVFDGINAIETAWEGANPATLSRSNEATRTLAAVAGQQNENQGFLGMAAPAEVVSTSVAIQGQSNFQPGFPISLQAIYYSLFGIADPAIYGPLGLSGPPTVYLNLYNAPFVDPVGQSLISLAYDAAATMLDVPIIFAAGEFGFIDNDTDCGTQIDELAPGAQRIGSRSLSAPATSFNGITVTAVGGRTVNQTPQYQFPYYVLPVVNSAQGPVDTAVIEAGAVTINRNERPGIDIAAPGWQSVLDTRVPLNAEGDPDPCLWFGHTPNGLINLPNNGNGQSPDPDSFGLAGGTNIAAAVVAGAVALLQDAGNKFFDDEFPEGGLSTAPLVIKAVLLNSAVRTPGWSNAGADGYGLTAQPMNRRDGRAWEETGVIIDGGTGGLDIAIGSGLLNVEQAFLQYLGPGVTKDPIETNPTVPTVTGGGPFIGEPVPPQGSGLAGGFPEPEDEVTPDGIGGGGNPPIGLPGRNPGGTGGGVIGPIPGGGQIGPIPGPGDPTDPAGEFSLRFFLSVVGLAPNEDGDLFDPTDPELNNPSDFPAFQIEGPPVNPRYPTIATFDPNNPNDVQRLYIWAGMEGSRLVQTWDNIAISIETTGDARIANYQFFNLSVQPIAGAPFNRWSVLSQGTPTPALPNAQRVNNIFGNSTASLTSRGVFKGPGVEFDIHYSDPAEATLLGYIDVYGQGEVFLEVGPNAVNLEDELPVDSRVFFGPGGTGPFADDNNPVIFGSNIGVKSAFPESLLESIGFLETPIPVRRVGWDHGNLGVAGGLNSIDYFIEEPYELNTLFTATLCWNRTVVIAADSFLNSPEPGVAPTLLQLELEDLDLSLWTADPFGNVETLLVGTGGSQTNVEHLRFTSNFPSLAGANLVLRVTYSGQVTAFENTNFADLEEIDLGDYDLRFLRPGDVEFGLAWATWSTLSPDRPQNVQDVLGIAYNLPEELLLPQSITQNASAAQLVQSLGDLLAAFGSSRGDIGYRTMLDLNNDGRIDADDLSLLLAAF